jgi:hypothetical protein
VLHYYNPTPPLSTAFHTQGLLGHCFVDRLFELIFTYVAPFNDIVSKSVFSEYH